MMSTAGMNALALARFGDFRVWRGGGFGLLLAGLIFVGVIVWAVTRTSATNRPKNQG